MNGSIGFRAGLRALLLIVLVTGMTACGPKVTPNLVSGTPSPALTSVRKAITVNQTELIVAKKGRVPYVAFRKDGKDYPFAFQESFSAFKISPYADVAAFGNARGQIGYAKLESGIPTKSTQSGLTYAGDAPITAVNAADYGPLGIQLIAGDSKGRVFALNSKRTTPWLVSVLPNPVVYLGFGPDLIRIAIVEGGDCYALSPQGDPKLLFTIAELKESRATNLQNIALVDERLDIIVGGFHSVYDLTKKDGWRRDRGGYAGNYLLEATDRKILAQDPHGKWKEITFEE